MITVQRAGDAAVVSLSQPDVHNAMGLTWPADLTNALARATELDPKVIVLRGDGPSFCSGVNTKHFAAGDLGPDWFRSADEALLALDRVAVPTIARIHGYCLGGGLQLASACDIRVAHRSATLGLPAQAEGLIPGMSFLRLSRLIGASWAADLILSGDVLTAAAAAGAGLVTRVTADVDEEVGRLVDRIAAAPARVTALSKGLLATVRLDGYADFAGALHDAMRQLLSAARPPDVDRPDVPGHVR